MCKDKFDQSRAFFVTDLKFFETVSDSIKTCFQFKINQKEINCSVPRNLNEVQNPDNLLKIEMPNSNPNSFELISKRIRVNKTNRSTKIV